MEDFDSTMERFVKANGLDAMKQMLARGDFVNGQEVKAQAFIAKKEAEALAAYLASPEYAAVRQANAAERANSIAVRSLAVALLALAVSVVALLLPFFRK
jgi:hypothetical protein